MILRLPVRHVGLGLRHLHSRPNISYGLQPPKDENNTFSPSRTISIRNLPREYRGPHDVANVLALLKLNPVETVSPSHFGRGILINCLDTKRAERCIASYHGTRLSLQLVRTDRSLAVYVVAAIGYTGLSRSCKIENIPQGVPEQQIKSIMCPQRLGNRRDFESWRFDPKTLRLDVRFMCLSQAMDAKENVFRSPILKGAKMTYCDTDESDYDFPEWYTPEEEHQKKVKRAVVVSNLNGPEKSFPCREWANDWQRISPTLLFCGLHPAKDLMHLEFATSTAAQQFVRQFQSRADELGVGMEIQETQYAVTRSLITAISLGASRTLVLTVEGTKSIPEIRQIFMQQGNITQLTCRQREKDTLFYITFENVSLALRTVMRIGRILNHGFPGLAGAIVGFLNAPHLKPVPIRAKARAKFNDRTMARDI
ncbi:hypothetical protein IW261DRAFT_1560380 [Armillaria novae-zelandiae]|uniref:Uncharacterized protein n=1 Tax=Armillaria novae-zelandiae TaxID=153914 RepID=A0AA39PI61_9AGAR|nr:hypothetical protein IW261DRAFT_1560380 [Armillaria novae-zelandiae]